MSLARITERTVIALVLLAAVATACVFVSGNVSWMREWTGFVWFFALAGGLLGGLIGGISLAIARKNPLWLLATVASLCMGYFGLALMYGIGLASMH